MSISSSKKKKKRKKFPYKQNISLKYFWILVTVARIISYSKQPRLDYAVEANNPKFLVA